MLDSPARYDLLRSRLRGFTRMLPRVKTVDTGATFAAWTADRRLRELLPVLQLDAPTAEKLGTRLRRIARRLEALRRSDALLKVLDDLAEAERRGRQATTRVRVDIQRLADRAHTDFFRKKTGNDVRRVSEKLTTVLERLRVEPESKARARARRWAVKARVARRATDVKSAINGAGSVYLASRLQNVCLRVVKLRYGAELAADVAGSVSLSDIRTLARAQRLLSELADIQVLIDRVRQVQSALPTPDLKAWRDLDILVIALENRCRGLHARYVRERTALVALCDRFVVHAPVEGDAKRKVS
jgi:CHAD domain-containing protein